MSVNQSHQFDGANVSLPSVFFIFREKSNNKDNYYNNQDLFQA